MVKVVSHCTLKIIPQHLVTIIPSFFHVRSRTGIRIQISHNTMPKEGTQSDVVVDAEEVSD